MNFFFQKRCFLFIITSFLVLNLPLCGQSNVYKQYSNPKIEYSNVYINGNKFQKDLLLFVDLLKASHPAFVSGDLAPFNIDSIKNEGYKWASTCRSDSELHYFLQKIASQLNDGHTLLIPDYNSPIYPFLFFKENQKIYLMGVDKKYESFLGKQILKINRSSVIDVIESFRSDISSENEIYFFDKVKNHMQFFSAWQNNPYCPLDSSLQLTFSDNTTITMYPVPKNKLNVVWAQAKDSPYPVIKQNSQLPFQYKLLHENRICYLQFDQCIDRSSICQNYIRSGNIPDEMEKKLLQIPRFDEFLNEMFQEIDKNKINTLVIDVRDNGGGNSILCDILLSWLKPINNIKKGGSSSRLSVFWEQSFPALATDYKQKIINSGQSYQSGKLYDNRKISSLFSDNKDQSRNQRIDPDFVMNTDSGKIFGGNIIFIQGTKTYSSAGMLIRDAVDNQIGIVIGEKSSYKPCHYGDMLGWELPNTKIKGYISYKIFYRPDTGKCNEQSLVPHIQLSAKWQDIICRRDIYWEWILENYSN